MFNKKLNALLLFWIISSVFLVFFKHSLISFEFLSQQIIFESINIQIAPLMLVMVLILFIYQFNRYRQVQKVMSYFLFFSISISSLFGFTQILNGSYVETSLFYFFGLSFYTASLAYLIQIRKVEVSDVFMISNPLFLITGPVTTCFKNIRYKNISLRLYYFLPFVILGFFLHQAIATPLTKTFILIEQTDLVSVIVFAIIFELFVYANFCGLSLIVYGIAGILGYQIPLNFKQPFSAMHLIDFWKGWHASLSNVLKMLFYSPIRYLYGVNLAIFVVFIASAMWHGMTLNFMLWGIFHAVFYIATRYLLIAKVKYIPVVLFIVGVVIARILFTDSNFSRLIEKLTFKFNGFGIFEYLMNISNSEKLSLLMIIAFVLIEFLLQNFRYFRRRNYKFYRLPLIQILIFIVTLLSETQNLGVDYAVYGQR